MTTASVVPLPNDSTTTAPDSTWLATITTDTGAFAPGHRDFSRYTTIGLCRAAGLWARIELQRRQEYLASRDTGTQTVDNDDSIGRETATVAQSCGGKFILADATTRQLGNLFDLAVFEQNDSLSQAVLARLIAQTSTSEERNTYWTNAVEAYLSAAPVRMTAVQSIIAKIDAQGPSNQAEQLDLARTMEEFFNMQNDTSRLRQAAERMITLGQKTKYLQAGDYVCVIGGYQDLMRLAIFGPPDSLLKLAQRAKHDLSQFGDSDQIHTLPLPIVVEKLAPAWYTEVVHARRDGPQAPRLQADYWFPTLGGDTVRPTRGKINLICRGIRQQDNERRWLAQYGTAGLVVTVIAIVDEGDSVPGNGSLWDISDKTPQEKELVRHYINQLYQQFPVTVAMQILHSQWLPFPDGRLWTEDTTRTTKSDVYASPCTVISRDGVVLYREDTNKDYTPGGHGVLGFESKESETDVVLKWLFAGPNP